jgi:hypothetical protein
MSICGRKDYLSETPDADRGISCWSETPRPAHFANTERPKLQAFKCASLMQINDLLDQLHCRRETTEFSLWQLLANTDRFRKTGGEVYWLTLMRIAELALLSAGRYADNCEFRAAGDLLANPALVLIHLKDRKKPLVKKRHAALSVTLRKEVSAGISFLDWFRQHVLLEVTQKALLPSLVDRLDACGPSAGGPAGETAGETIGGIKIKQFRERIEACMRKVADTIAFLSAWQIDDAMDLLARIEESSSDTRRFITANLCRFKDTQFIQIGATIRKLVTGGTPHSEEAATRPSN